MTHAQNTPGPRAATRSGPASSRPAGVARLLPSVTFGARAAVLAGVVAVCATATAPAASAAATGSRSAHVTTTVALGGAISGLMRPADTTWGG